MRVFVDATGVTSVPTGLAKYSLKLLESLVESTAYEYMILCSPRLPEEHKLFSLPADRVAFLRREISTIGPKRDFEYGRLKVEIARSDVYHCLSSYLPVFGVPVPSLVTVHDLKYVRFPEFMSSRLKAWYLRYVIIKTLHNASHIIAVSDSTRHDLVSLGADAKKVTVVHEAGIIDAPEGYFCGGKNEILGDYFLFVGENRPHKNLDRLLEAYRLLMLDHPIALPILVIAGNGVCALEGQITRLGLDGKVITLCPVTDEELIELYGKAFAFVFPSLYEGFGLPILEAMSLGTPVITSNVTSTAEVAGSAAELVDPRSSQDIKRGMENLLLDPMLRSSRIKAGRERASHFSWGKAALETARIYAMLAKCT
jgi:glycosyltransferase involved in cell wall biosynthesis